MYQTQNNNMHIKVFEPYWKRRILAIVIVSSASGIGSFIFYSDITQIYIISVLLLVFIVIDFIKLKKTIITTDKIKFDYFIMKYRNFAIKIDKIDRIYFLFRAKGDTRIKFYLKGIKSPTVVISQLSHAQIKELYFVLKGFNIKLEGSKILYTILKG
jgi:hypothetical protein